MPQLPVIQPREEFGFKRTSCGCAQCSKPCEFTPGPLSPTDVLRIAFHLGYDDIELFARENLTASAGALLGRVNPIGQVSTYRVPTVVPARQENGHCKFLQGGKCAIHAVSPFGCAMFDSHQDKQEGDKRSLALHGAIQQEHINKGPYHLLWNILDGLGLKNAPPEETTAKWRQLAQTPLYAKKTGWIEKKDRNKKKRRK